MSRSQGDRSASRRSSLLAPIITSFQIM